MSQPSRPAAPTPTPAEILLAHRGWLRGFVRRLVEDEAHADDLEQQALLAALETMPADVRAPRAWLASVARNWLSSGRRGAKRRREREEVVSRPDRSASTADVVAHAEMHRRVTNAVMQLDEPYRTTILLRFFENLPPREVASRMDVPVETVRTRVRRGLERLRAQLDEDHGSRRGWAVPLVAAVVGDGARPGAPIRVVRPSTVAAALTGGALMASSTTIIGGAAAALLVMVVVASAPWGSAPAVHTAEERGAVAPLVDDAAPLRERVRASDSAVATDSAGETAATPAAPPERESARPDMAHARGRIIGLAESGARESGELMLMFISGKKSESPLTVQSGLATHGEFDVPVGVVAHSDAGYEEVAIRVDHPSFLLAQKRFPLPKTKTGRDDLIFGDVDVGLVAATTVRGEIRLPDGSPAVRANVRLFEDGPATEKREPFGWTRSLADGMFAVRGRPGRRALLAVVCEGAAPFVRDLGVLGSESTEIDVVELLPGASIQGTAMRPDGTSLAAAVVAYERPSLGVDLAFPMGMDKQRWLTVGATSVAFGRQEVRCDDDGAFVFDDLDLANGTLSVVKTWRLPVARGALRASAMELAPPANDVRLVLDGAWVRVEVTSEGRPVEANVTANQLIDQELLPCPRADEDGVSGFLAQPGLRYALWTRRFRYAMDEREIVAPAAGETLVVQVELEREGEEVEEPKYGSLNVVARLPDGSLLQSAGLVLREPNGQGGSFNLPQVRESGLFIGAILARRYELRVRPEAKTRHAAGGYYPDAIVPVEIRAGEKSEVHVNLRLGGRLRLDARAPDGTFLAGTSCKLVDAEGTFVPVVLTGLRSRGGHETSINGEFGHPAALVGDGPNDVVGALAPGRYTVHFERKGYRAMDVRVTLVAGETSRLEVTLQPK